jgi:hypothetical protein
MSDAELLQSDDLDLDFRFPPRLPSHGHTERNKSANSASRVRTHLSVIHP